MVKFNQLIILIFSIVILLTGCGKNDVTKEKPKKNIIAEYKEKIEAKNKMDIKNSIPPIIFPRTYKKPKLATNGVKIDFSAVNAPLTKVLYIITKKGGLNLVIDEGVNLNKKVTLSLSSTPLEDALDIVMDISDSYFEIKGNILHVKKYMSRIFELPFINMKPKTTFSLGGDIVGTDETQEAADISGEFTIENESDEDLVNYYEQLEKSFENLLSEEGKYSMNKFSGTLIVTDYKRNVLLVEKMINNLNKFLSKQVLIDAKIMEVVLNNEHQLGVNWDKAWTVASGAGSLVLSQSLSAASSTQFLSGVNNPVTGGIASTLSYTTSNFNGVIQAMELAGDIEVVSNPRLKVLNGQSGIIMTGNKVPYWEKEVSYATTESTTTPGELVTTPTITYERTDVLDGITLGVTPIIKSNGDVLLNIVPIISTIEGETSFSDGTQIVATAPIVNIKEVGTTVLTKNNDMIVIGGLISSRKANIRTKTPALGDIPAVGNLFRRTETNSEKRELVIILKIDVNGNNSL